MASCTSKCGKNVQIKINMLEKMRENLNGCSNIRLKMFLTVLIFGVNRGKGGEKFSQRNRPTLKMKKPANSRRVRVSGIL
jgi:hypothetical protein